MKCTYTRRAIEAEWRRVLYSAIALCEQSRRQRMRRVARPGRPRDLTITVEAERRAS